jgi:hypothetical protein
MSKQIHRPFLLVLAILVSCLTVRATVTKVQEPPHPHIIHIVSHDDGISAEHRE